jgi:hypothetical protein
VGGDAARAASPRTGAKRRRGGDISSSIAIRTRCDRLCRGRFVFAGLETRLAASAYHSSVVVAAFSLRRSGDQTAAGALAVAVATDLQLDAVDASLLERFFPARAILVRLEFAFHRHRQSNAAPPVNRPRIPPFSPSVD